MAYLQFLACSGFCYCLWTLFVTLDKHKALFKQRLLNRITTLLLSPASIFTVLTWLPSGLIPAFDAIFKGNLYSLRGFVRSCKLSLVLVGLLFVWWYSTIPDYVRLEIHTSPLGLNDYYFQKMPAVWYYSVVSITRETGYYNIIMTNLVFTFLLPLLYNFGFDYLALIFTREVLKHLSTLSSARVLIIPFVLVICLLVISVIAYFGFTIASMIGGFPRRATYNYSAIGEMLHALAFPFYARFPGILGRWSIDTIMGVFLYSTFFGIIWIGLFSIALIVSKLSMKISFLGPWLRDNLRVRQHPFKATGGLLVVIVSVMCVIFHLVW